MPLSAIPARATLALMLALLLGACSPPAAEPAPASAPAPSATPAPAAEPAPTPVAEGTGSCDAPKIGMCSETFGDKVTAAEAKSYCVGPGQIYSPAACDTAGRLGSCLAVAVAMPGSTVRVRTHYASDFYGGAAAAQQVCEGTAKGEWTAG